MQALFQLFIHPGLLKVSGTALGTRGIKMTRQGSGREMIQKLITEIGVT